MSCAFDNGGGVRYRQHTVTGLIQKVHRHRPAVSLGGVDVVGVGEAHIGLSRRNHPHRRAVAGDNAYVIGSEPLQNLPCARGAVMGKPTGHVPAGRAEFGRCHNQPALPLDIKNILKRLGGILGGDSVGAVGDDSCAQGEAIPPAVRVGVQRGPVPGCITAVGGEKRIPRQANGVEDFARPKDIGNGRSRLRSYFLNQADRLARLSIEPGQDLDAGLLFKLSNDRLGDSLIHRAIQDHLSSVGIGTF